MTWATSPLDGAGNQREALFIRNRRSGLYLRFLLGDILSRRVSRDLRERRSSFNDYSNSVLNLCWSLVMS
jgi:hypothetical protein